MTEMVYGGFIADGVLNLLTVLFIAFTVKKEPAVTEPAPNIPDPMPAAAKSLPPVVQPEPEPIDVVESGLQVRDLIEESRENTNQPAGKGGIFGFFKK